MADGAEELAPERHYGALQGLKKAETAERCGSEQVPSRRVTVLLDDQAGGNESRKLVSMALIPFGRQPQAIRKLHRD